MALRHRLEMDIRSKRYPGAPVAALDALRFSVLPGEFTAVVGPSGSGKSTLLNIVGGLDRDYDGSVCADNRSLHAKGEPAVRIGFVFQDPRLMPWLTVMSNLLLVLDKQPDSNARAVRLLQDVGLADVADAFPNQLSVGMQRRVALVRAFAVRPELLLMDEPFLSLDAPGAARLRRLLMVLCEQLQPTVLFVTHNLREALALAERVVFMSGAPGRVVLDIPVELPRPRTLDGPAINALHDRLLARHPDLLSGLARDPVGAMEAAASDDEPVATSIKKVR